MVEADSAAQVAQLKEVCSFLDNKQARSQALEIILSQTGSDESHAPFTETDIVKRCLRLILDAENV